MVINEACWDFFFFLQFNGSNSLVRNIVADIGSLCTLRNVNLDSWPSVSCLATCFIPYLMSEPEIAPHSICISTLIPS